MPSTALLTVCTLLSLVSTYGVLGTTGPNFASTVVITSTVLARDKSLFVTVPVDWPKGDWSHELDVAGQLYSSRLGKTQQRWMSLQVTGARGGTYQTRLASSGTLKDKATVDKFNIGQTLEFEVDTASFDGDGGCEELTVKVCVDAAENWRNHQECETRLSKLCPGTGFSEENGPADLVAAYGIPDGKEHCQLEQTFYRFNLVSLMARRVELEGNFLSVIDEEKEGWKGDEEDFTPSEKAREIAHDLEEVVTQYNLEFQRYRDMEHACNPGPELLFDLLLMSFVHSTAVIDAESRMGEAFAEAEKAQDGDSDDAGPENNGFDQFVEVSETTIPTIATVAAGLTLAAVWGLPWAAISVATVLLVEGNGLSLSGIADKVNGRGFNTALTCRLVLPNGDAVEVLVPANKGETLADFRARCIARSSETTLPSSATRCNRFCVSTTQGLRRFFNWTGNHLALGYIQTISNAVRAVLLPHWASLDTWCMVDDDISLRLQVPHQNVVNAYRDLVVKVKPRDTVANVIAAEGNTYGANKVVVQVNLYRGGNAAIAGEEVQRPSRIVIPGLSSSPSVISPISSVGSVDTPRFGRGSPRSGISLPISSSPDPSRTARSFSFGHSDDGSRSVESLGRGLPSSVSRDFRSARVVPVDNRREDESLSAESPTFVRGSSSVSLGVRSPAELGGRSRPSLRSAWGERTVGDDELGGARLVDSEEE